MSNIKEVNGRLGQQSYLEGFVPSNADAKLFTELLGANTAVVQWAAQMASYYQSERAEILKPTPKKEAPKAVAAAAAAPAADDDEDSDVDLFGEETPEETAAKEAKKAALAAYKAKKAEKPAVQAKSSILMDIKPYDDTTDLEELAKKLKAIEKEGLLWGAHKLVPVAYGVKKLQILMVIHDDKISSDDIEEMIVDGFEDEVQSMDIVAWNKI